MKTEKWLLFKNYLIKKIGFINDSFLQEYISILNNIYPKLKYLGKQKKIWSESQQIFLLEKENPYINYIEKENYFLPEKFGLIDLMLIELNTKKNKEYILKEIRLDYISATDISNFTYCAVSFAISKTFKLPILESTILGTSQHEKHKLITYLRPVVSENRLFDEKIIASNPYLNDTNQLFFNELSKSSIIFYGHDSTENKNKYFKSKKGNFVGQPDYIFKNEITNNIFVVEEKFQYIPSDPFFYGYINSEQEELEILKKRSSKNFFKNHKNQTSSYIYGISEYEIKYGYLVYWKYELYEGNPNIVACNVLRINKTEKGRQELNNIFLEIKNLIKNQKGFFEINDRIPAKCASCISNLLCGHKTGKYNDFSIPYSNKYLKLFYAPFPEELKKQIPEDVKEFFSTQNKKQSKDDAE